MPDSHISHPTKHLIPALVMGSVNDLSKTVQFYTLLVINCLLY